VQQLKRGRGGEDAGGRLARESINNQESKGGREGRRICQHCDDDDDDDDDVMVVDGERTPEQRGVFEKRDK
jgi:hypothetical protein